MSALNKSQLEALKKELPRGYFNQIVEKVGCSKQSVTNVFKGECKDPELIDRIITEAIKLKDKKLKKEQAIAKKIQEAVA